MTRYQLICDGSGQGFNSVQIQKDGVIVEVQYALYSDDTPAAGTFIAGAVILQKANAAEIGVQGILPQTIDLGGIVSAVGGAAAGTAENIPLNAHHACAMPVALGDNIFVTSIAGPNIVGLIQFIVRD